jgi:hypothetical protein
LKRIVLFALILAVAVVLLSQAAPSERTVEAERFVLKDAEGRERARLALALDDLVSFVLLDANGTSRAVLAAAPDGTTGLMLNNREGKTQFRARVQRFGPASVTVFDSDSWRRAALSVAGDGTSSVKLSAGKRPIVRLVSGVDQSSRLAFVDGTGQERSLLGLGSDGSPVLRLNSADGSAVFREPAESGDP